MNIDWSVTAQIITAITALAAVIAGPIVTIKIAKRQSDDMAKNLTLQIHAEVISKNRQDWINTLRDEIASFVGDLNVYGIDGIAQTSATSEPAIAALQKIMSRLYRIKLLLNPNESDHQNLDTLLFDLQGCVNDHKKFAAKQGEVIALSQKILKSEWERVKVFT